MTNKYLGIQMTHGSCQVCELGILGRTQELMCIFELTDDFIHVPVISVRQVFRLAKTLPKNLTRAIGHLLTRVARTARQCQKGRDTTENKNIAALFFGVYV